jgi:hypothetical protein
MDFVPIVFTASGGLGIVMSKAYGLYLGCLRAPIKHRIGSWIQTSHRRHGVEPNGSVPLAPRCGSHKVEYA